jgi:hypothetical protein
MFSVWPSAVPVDPILKIDQGCIYCCAFIEVPFPCCRVGVVQDAGIGARGHPSDPVAPTWLNPEQEYSMSANGNVSISKAFIGYVRGLRLQKQHVRFVHWTVDFYQCEPGVQKVSRRKVAVRTLIGFIVFCARAEQTANCSPPSSRSCDFSAVRLSPLAGQPRAKVNSLKPL